MNGPYVTRDADGALVLEGLDFVHAAVLPEVPRLIAQTDDVEERFLQLPSEDDDERNEEWRRLVHPEIFALLASAREIVERDLQGLTCRDDAPVWRVAIPDGHLDAWIAAINAARVALGARHGFTEDEMNEGPSPGEDPERGAAMVMVHLLGGIEWILVECVLPPPDQDASE